MSFNNQTVPSLNSLVQRADALLKQPLEADTMLPRITSYFDEATSVQVSKRVLDHIDVSEYL